MATAPREARPGEARPGEAQPGEAQPGPARVRSLHVAVRVEAAEAPNDTAHVRVYYPAAPTGSDEERLTGLLPPDRTCGPRPVVIVLPAVNVAADGYRWLAVALVEAGFVAVTYNHVGELMAGLTGLSPGIDLSALTPDTFGTRPSATAVRPVLAALRELDARGTLEGMLDLGHVALGGHSAGGTVALENADPAWFPGVGAVFSYGSHTMPVAALGFGAGTVLPVGPVPAMICAGADDGVILASADRYGRRPGEPGHLPVARTFDEGIRDDLVGYEVVFAGANHLLVVDPDDPTSARGFLDPEPTADPVAGRALFAEGLVAFLGRHLLRDSSAGDPREVLGSSTLVASVRRRG